MATNGHYSLDNYVKCFSDRVLEELINTATRDEDTGEEMLKWVKEKRTNLATNYKNVQVFFEDELDCENVDEELRYNPNDTTPTQIKQIAFGLKHVLCMVKKEIKELLFTPNLKIDKEYMKKIAARKKTKKRKSNLNTFEKFLKKARLDEEQIDKDNSQNSTDGQTSAAQNRVLKELISLDKQKTDLTNEKADLETCITQLDGVYSKLMNGINASNNEKAEVEKILVDEKAKLTELRGKMADEKAQLENIKKETGSTESSLDKLKKEKAIVEKTLVDEKAELTELTGELEEKERILENVNVSIAESEKQDRNLRRGINDQLKEFEMKSAQLSSLFKNDLINTMNILDSKTLLRKMQLKGGHSSEFNSKRKKRIKTQAQGVESLLDSSSDDHDKLVMDI